MLNLFYPTSSQKNSTAGKTSSQELSHVNEEIYKKNAQLVETNKLLSLLRSIDEIILSAVTDIQNIAARVATLVVELMRFKGFGILVLDKTKNQLNMLAFSQLIEEGNDPQHRLGALFDNFVLPMDQGSNILVAALMGRTQKVTHALAAICASGPQAALAPALQQTHGIKSIVAYPLIVRNILIGEIVILFSEDEATLTPFTRDLIVRLGGVIGIALDNALLYQQIQFANQKLKELDQLKDDFVSVASHELRTPMTVIKSYLWMALHEQIGKLNPKQHTYLDRAYSSTVRLINLVNEMLNVSRIESGRMSVAVQKADLLELTKSILLEIKPRADELKIRLDVKERALPPVLADTDKIKEIIINLVGNSLKFTPAGGVVTISYDVGEDYVTTHVQDTGVGIEQGYQATLFQKFGFDGTSYKANKSNASGTGLGLYICKSIIELHRGTISAYSGGRGKGATFSFTLKMYNDADLEAFNSKYGDNKSGLGVIHSGI